MTPIGDVLQADHVILALAARDPAGAINEVLARLEGDERVKDFAMLRDAVLAQPAPAIAENGCGICVAHGRTESISSLVVAAGRSIKGVKYPGLADPVKLFSSPVFPTLSLRSICGLWVPLSGCAGTSASCTACWLSGTPSGSSRFLGPGK